MTQNPKHKTIKINWACGEAHSVRLRVSGFVFRRTGNWNAIVRLEPDNARLFRRKGEKVRPQEQNWTRNLNSGPTAFVGSHARPNILY